MWKELIRSFIPYAAFSEGASVFRIEDTEALLNVTLPSELRSLLMESNGVTEQYGCALIWPIDRIREDNLRFRQHSEFAELHMPFDHLLFFADAGNGDQFAYPIHAGRIRRADVFAWNHEDDSRTWVAPSLAKFFEWWSSGKLKF